ncbi:MAG: PAS domain S-box protein, partial [Verrucomicrobiota bacterium]
MAGHQWLLSFTRHDSAGSNADYKNAWVILAGGTLISLLLAGLFRSLINTRFNARRIAGQLTADLRVEAARRRALFEQSPDGILIIDPQTSGFLEFNTEAHRQLGYSREEFARLTICDVEMTETAEEIKARIAGVMQKGRADFETLHRTRQGEARNVHVTAQLLEAEGQKVYQCVWRDITERKREHEELLSFRKAVEQTANTIVITDPEGNIEYVNPAFEITTGYTADEAIGQTLRILKTGEHAPSFYQKLWAEIKSGRIWRGEFHNKRKDGSLFWESAIISPVHEEQGEIVHFIAVKHDITERKQAQDEILRINRQLAEATAKAERATGAKSEFLANMSHEIRTPLNGVIGMNSLLLESGLNDKQRRYAEIASASGKTLLALINDILDFSKI